jgi:hypothetical protein
MTCDAHGRSAGEAACNSQPPRLISEARGEHRTVQPYRRLAQVIVSAQIQVMLAVQRDVVAAGPPRAIQSMIR